MIELNEYFECEIGTRNVLEINLLKHLQKIVRNIQG